MTRPTFTLSITHDNIMQATQFDGKMTKPVSIPPNHFAEMKKLVEKNANPQEIGQALYDKICILLNLKTILKDRDNLRLRLDIEPPDLAALPWEMLYDGQNWLAVSGHRAIVRTTTKQTQLDSLAVNKLNILLVGASPKHRPDLEIKRIEEINRLLDDAVEKKQLKRQQIECKQLLDATWEQVSHELARNYYHILYFIGHGTPTEIYFDDGEGADIKKGHKPGDSYPVTVPMLADALKKNNNLRLLFLAACDTAKYEDGSSFATNLLAQTSLPVLVAMQAEVDDERANLLAARFFIALASFDEVDVALTEARTALQTSDDISPDAFAPVMYLQAYDGRLFKAARNWALWGLIALLPMLLILSGLFYNQRQLTNFEQSQKIAAQTSEAVAMVTAAARGTSEAIAQATGKAEAAQRVIARETANAEATGKAVEGARADVEATRRVYAQETSAAESAAKVIAESTRTFQHKVSLSLQLAKMSETELNNDNLEIGTLLAIESMKISSSSQGNQLLQTINNSLMKPMKVIQNYEHSKVTISPNDKLLAISSLKDFVYILDITNGQTLSTFQADHMGPTIFSPNSKLLATTKPGVNGESIIIWDIENKREFSHIFPGLIGMTQNMNTGESGWAINSMVFSADNNLLALGGVVSGVAQVWNITTGEKLVELKHYEKEGKYSNLNIDIAPNGKYLATAGIDGIVKIWDLQTQQELFKHIHKINDSANEITLVKFSPNGKFIASSTNGSSFNVLVSDITIRKEQIFTYSGEGYLKNIIFSFDSKYLAICADAIYVWDMEKKELIFSVSDNNPYDDPIDIKFSPDGKFLAVGSREGIIKIYSLVTGKEVGKGYCGEESACNVNFSSDSHFLLSHTYYNGKSIIWSMTFDTKQEVFKADYGGELAFSNDAKLLVLAPSSKKNIEVWDIATQKIIKQIYHSKESVGELYFQKIII